MTPNTAKPFNLGFIIIAPEPNNIRFKSTLNSIKKNYGDVHVNYIVPKKTPAADIKPVEGLCEVYKGKDTITSLLNSGFKHGYKEWNIVVMEGVWVKNNIDKKYSYFLQDEKDILFPVVTDYDIQGKPIKIHNAFWDCSLNGLMIHQKTFKMVGDLCDGDLENSRLIWAAEATEKECKFKGILGAKLC